MPILQKTVKPLSKLSVLRAFPTCNGLFYFLPISRKAEEKTLPGPNGSIEVHLAHSGWEWKTAQLLQKVAWQVFRKLSTKLLCDPVHLDILQRIENWYLSKCTHAHTNIKTNKCKYVCAYKHACIAMSHCSQQANNWDNLNVHRWIHILWYIHVVEYNSAIKKNGVLIHNVMCIGFKDTVLRERTPAQRSHSTYVKYPGHGNPRRGKLKTGKVLWARGRGKRIKLPSQSVEHIWGLSKEDAYTALHILGLERQLSG